MNKVRITAVRKTEYPDLMARFENPIEHACDDSNKWENLDATCLPRLSGPGGDVKAVAEVQVEA